jgi:hypothetical protein
VITTIWSFVAVLALSGCVVLGIEGALATTRRRDAAAIVAAVALAAVVLADGWATAAAVAGSLLFLLAALWAVTRWSQRRHQAAD